MCSMDTNRLVELRLYGTAVKLCEKMQFNTYGDMREWLCTLLGFSAFPEEYGMYVKTPSKLKKGVYLQKICAADDTFLYPRVLYLMRNNRTTSIQMFYENDEQKQPKNKQCCTIM